MMFNFTVYAHEEGVSKGPDSWIGSLIFFAIIFVSIITAKIIRKKWRVFKSDKKGEVNVNE